MSRERWSFSRAASGNPAHMRTASPICAEAADASRARVAAEPELPISPAVRSSTPTLFPRPTLLMSVPPQRSSASSGWAITARISSGALLSGMSYSARSATTGSSRLAR